MLVLEYKAVTKKHQELAIDEAIGTSKFVPNKVLRYGMDSRGVGKKELYRYNTQIRTEFKFVKELNSHAYQASVENVERAINRFYDNCKKNKPGKKADATPRRRQAQGNGHQAGYPRFKKHARSVEYKQSGCQLQRDVNAAINILVKGTGGHPGTNARGVATPTILGPSLVEQVATVNRESSRL